MREMEERRSSAAVIAAMLAASAGILAIGILNLIAELNEGVKDFLSFSHGMGSLSGKITLSYALALVLFLALFRIRALERWSLKLMAWILFACLLVATLLVFPPFVELF